MEQDKIAQVAAFIVAIIIGVVTYFRPGKPAAEAGPDRAEQHELARLRDQVIDERNQRIAEEIKSVRHDFEKIIGALNVSIKTHLDTVGVELAELSRVVNSVNERVHAAERKLDVVEDRQRRSEH